MVSGGKNRIGTYVPDFFYNLNRQEFRIIAMNNKKANTLTNLEEEEEVCMFAYHQTSLLNTKFVIKLFPKKRF